MKNLFFVLILLIVGCKSKTKENIVNTEEPATIEAVKELHVIMSFKTNIEDNFQLAVNNIIKDEFQKKSVIITEKVTPSSDMETIDAKFGENIISNSIRFDLGNKEVKEMEIESINFSYGENSLYVSGSQLHEYFIINKFVAYDSLSKKIKTQKVDGVHYPAIALNRKAINIITKE